MLPAISNVNIPHRGPLISREQGSNKQRDNSDMFEDIKRVASKLEMSFPMAMKVPLYENEEVSTPSYVSRLIACRDRERPPLECPVYDPRTIRRYDPSARSAVSSGMMSAHYSSDPLLSALRFQACASPTAQQNPNSEWATYISRVQDYLAATSPPPPVFPPKSDEQKSTCCVIM